MSTGSRVAFLLSLAALPFGQAAAQERVAVDRATDPVEEVVVTGSHIRGADVAPVVNVQVFERGQLEQTGASQVADLLKEIPANTGSALYNETGQLSGTAQFQLRGLGFSSTLTLLNGRRAGIAPLSDKSGADFLDINQFPLAMIERVEVLKDGASAIYGSEAVAGVVNLVTRKGFEGLELSGDYSSSSNDAFAINLASGRRFEGGSMNFYATYYDQSGNVRTDFPWLIERIGGNGVDGRSQLLSSNGYPGTYSRATLNASGTPVVVAGAVARPDPNCEAGGGVFSIGDNGVTNTSRCNFDFVDQIGVVPQIQRIQSFFESDFELSARLSYFNEIGASRNVNEIYKQPGGFSNGSISGGLVYVPANHPFNFFVADPASATGLRYIEPANWNPAVDQAVPVAGNLRPEGNYFSGEKRQTNTNLRVLNGLELSLAGSWRASASHGYTFAEFEENDPVRFNAPALNSLLLSGDYNPFALANLNPTLVSPKDGQSVAGNDEAVLSRVFYTANIVRRTEQHVADLSASGPVIELPTGAVSVALGAQYREQSLKYLPDSLSAQGLADSPATDAGFSGSQQVRAGYAEVMVPIHDVLRLQAAVRHEDYGGGIGSTTDPKLSARLNLFSGVLGIRGSWGTSFQAPTLTHNATSQAFVIINDPVVLGPSGLACSSTTFGNNVNVVTSVGGLLTPQTSENYNLGIDVQPTSALSLTADYWRYDYQDLIAAGQNGQSIVSGQCVNGVFVNDPRVTRGASGQIFRIDTAYVNVGKVIADGIDLSASYAMRGLLFQADATYVNKFDSYAANGAVTHAVGSRNFNSNFAPMPAWRGTARAVWSWRMHELAAGVNYTDSYRNDQSNNAPIDRFITADLQYRLRFDRLIYQGASEIRIGVNNVFDKDPPSLIRYNAAGQLVSGTVSDIDRPGYDALAGASIQGRIVYLKLTQSF